MNKRKWLAIVLALAMVLTMLPAMAMADVVEVDPEDDLQTKIDEANPGDTIVLGGDITLTDAVTIEKNITLDLNENTLSSSAEYTILVKTGAALIVENGTIANTDAEGTGIGCKTKSSVTVESDVIINAYRGVRGTLVNENLGNVTMLIKGTIDCDEIAVFGSGPKNNITLDGANITSNYYSVYQNGSYGGSTYIIKNSKLVNELDGAPAVYISNNKDNSQKCSTRFSNFNY